jgi:adenosine/AMP deaminase-like protein
MAGAPAAAGTRAPLPLSGAARCAEWLLAAFMAGREQADRSKPEPASAAQARIKIRSGFRRARAPMARNELLMHIGRSGGANGFVLRQQIASSRCGRAETRCRHWRCEDGRVSYPKIELHVHLEGTVRPAALLRIARRNGVALPADSVEELTAIYEFRDFPHFLEIWWLTSGALPRRRGRRISAAALRARVCPGKGRWPWFGTARGRGRRARLGPGRDRRARRGPDQARHPRGRGSRPARRAGGARHRARRMSHVEPADRRRPLAR